MSGRVVFLASRRSESAACMHAWRKRTMVPDEAKHLVPLCKEMGWRKWQRAAR